MSTIIISVKLERSCVIFLLSYFSFNDCLFKNKHYFLLKQRYHSYYYTSQEGDRVLAVDWQTKQKKTSKTAPDKRQSFINKDVLSMKIISMANPNMAQDPKLLLEFCQQTLLKETVQQRGQGWCHSSFLTNMLHSTCPSPHSSSVICSSVSRGS